MGFQLHEQLRNDCHILGKMDSGYLLLLDNDLVPWFILVPETTETEFYRLDAEMQSRVMADVNRISEWVDLNLEIDKLNVAMIGNKVPQLHIHIIGRRCDDFCWPGVVWSATEKQPYAAQELDVLKQHIIGTLGLDVL